MKTLNASLAGLLATILLAACGGGGSSSPAPLPPDPPTTPSSFTVSASTTQLLAGGKPLAIEASVKAGDAVTWQLAAGSPGSIAGSGASATYTPPATVAANTPVTVNATSGGSTRSFSFTLFPEPGTAGLSLVAGSTAGHGMVDGPGTTARFSFIQTISRSRDGGLLVADRLLNNNVAYSALRKTDRAGNVTTLLRTVEGHADGSSAQARLGTLYGMTQAADGAIWFYDSYGSTQYLRKLGADGTVSTVRSGEALKGVGRLQTAPDGTMYSAGPRSLWKISTGGDATLLAGSETPFDTAVDGTGGAARFSAVNDFDITPAGDLVVADRSAIRKVTPAGVTTTLAGVLDATVPGDPLDGAVASATFQNPNAITVNAAGDVLVLDGLKVRKLAAGMVSTIASAPAPVQSSGYSLQTQPMHMRAIGSGPVLVAHEAQIDELAGDHLAALAGLEASTREPRDGSGADARFARPRILAADLAGNTYVVDDNTVYRELGQGPQGLSLRKIAPDGKVTTLANDAQFGDPVGMAVDKQGNVYIVESPVRRRFITRAGGAVYKITPDGKRSLLAGYPVGANDARDPAGEGYVDGAGTVARFNWPALAGHDRDGTLYLLSEGRVRKITPDGTTSTVSALPAGLEYDRAPDGQRYGSDGSSTVFRINADGSETVIAGVRNFPGTSLGTLPGGLDYPNAIVQTGPYTFAVGSGGAVLKLVLPH